MSLLKVQCPGCDQVIINPVPNAENTLRCPACRKPFEFKPSSVIAQDNGAADSVANTQASPVPIAAVAETAAAIQEPAPASYGLLTGIAWSALFFAGAVVYLEVTSAPISGWAGVNFGIEILPFSGHPIGHTLAIVDFQDIQAYRPIGCSSGKAGVAAWRSAEAA